MPLIPHPERSEFCIQNALACARLSQAAYGTLSPDEMRAIGINEPQWIVDQETDTQCLLATDDSAIVIAFRGTKEPHDFITDAKFRMTRRDGDAMVHRGFMGAWEGVRDTLDRGLQRIPNWGELPVLITGHSLGGALASLCTATFDMPTMAVYTFGSPRVGNRRFASLYRGAACHYSWKRTFRVVHEEDLVARLPLWTLGYRHVGREVFLDSFGRVTFEAPLVYRLASDIVGIVEAWSENRRAVIGDHGIARYIHRLEMEARRA